MLYCQRCKVSLADGASRCPLCLGPSAETLGGPEIPGNEEKAPSVDRSGEGVAARGDRSRVSIALDIWNAEDGSRLSLAERRKVGMELLSVSFAFALVITLALDAIFVPGLSWSLYVSVILVLVWIFSFMPLAFWGHPWLLFSVLGPALPLGLIAWGLCIGSLSWFLPVGLPIVIAFESVTISVLVLLKVMKSHGLNIPAVILMGAGVLCVGIDVPVYYAIAGMWGLSWSLVVAFSVFPVAGLFFYLHYRLLKKASLRKLFRL